MEKWRKECLIIARELCYSATCREKIVNAETENEARRALTTERTKR